MKQIYADEQSVKFFSREMKALYGNKEQLLKGKAVMVKLSENSYCLHWKEVFYLAVYVKVKIYPPKNHKLM